MAEDASTATAPAEQKQEETQSTENKNSAYEGVVTGKYSWGGDVANKNAEVDAGCEITKYSWSDGKSVSIYVELEGLDDVSDDQITTKNTEKEVTLTIGAIGNPPKKRVLQLRSLFSEITGAKATQKKGKNMISLKLAKKEQATWPKLLDVTTSAPADDEEGGPGMGGMGGMPGMGGMGGMPGMGGMGGMPGMGGMGGMPGMGGMGGMDMASMMSQMGGMGGMGGDMGDMGDLGGPGDEEENE
eukprot:TRINITY_DN608_c0_g1_i3.p1 TRINITY_DN608_c0_g1~~TRINITY_DN608_c0_g1_i3.p1  ORF type:complete len:243 (-),score=50.03 TRINITY_DN608_c0_g1_i3:130-858(-)